MARTISVIVKPPNRMDDRSAPLGILKLTFRPYVYGDDPWKAYTGTNSGFGKVTKGEWRTSLDDAAAGNRYHYYVFNSSHKLFLTLLSVIHPGSVEAGDGGWGELHFSGGGTLDAGSIEWRVLGAY